MNGLTGREKMITDEQEIIRILDESKVVHVGMVDGDEPYVVPMNYGYTLENGKLTIWLHGSKRGRKQQIERSILTTVSNTSVNRGVRHCYFIFRICCKFLLRSREELFPFCV